ncbi:MAG: class I SAM-dependent methyltransferase [Acidisphaera sp.]|nr:class I SAM-dependent methyltransferase [Acidisphaera sp.]
MSRSDQGRLYEKDDYKGEVAHGGIDYKDFFSILNGQLLPRTYLEIGTDVGESLSRWECDAICVDPNFRFGQDPTGRRRRTFLFQMTSREFFAHYDPRLLFHGGVDVAFQDGLHRFEELLHDFIGTERCCHRNSLMILHDCLPLNERMAEKDFRMDETEAPWTKFHWTGDVWRILPILKELRPDLRIFLIDCPPTGLVLCSRLNPYSTALLRNFDTIVSRYSAISLSSFGLSSLYQMFPMLDSRKIAADPQCLANVLDLR